MNIHPTAIVDPAARLGGGVEIGPHAIIGAGVVLGAGCRVLAHAILEGDLVAGDNNTFGYGCVIGTPPQDFAFDPACHSGVRIGSHNTFREYVTIHRGTKEGSMTGVGDGCYLMVNAHMGHNSQLGNRVVMANDVLLAGYVEIGDGAIIAGGAMLHQFMRVGTLAMVRGGARVGKDVPPYTFAETKNQLLGINSIGLRRSGLSADARNEIRRAYKLVFRSGYNVSQALAEARKQTWGPEAAAFVDFVASSKRGVCTANRMVGASAQADE